MSPGISVASTFNGPGRRDMPPAGIFRILPLRLADVGYRLPGKPACRRILDYLLALLRGLGEGWGILTQPFSAVRIAIVAARFGCHNVEEFIAQFGGCA
jgi:hypothetical protein